MAWDRWDQELIINVPRWETYWSSLANLVKFGVVSRHEEVSDLLSLWRAKSLPLLPLDAVKQVYILFKSSKVVL